MEIAEKYNKMNLIILKDEQAPIPEGYKTGGYMAPTDALNGAIEKLRFCQVICIPKDWTLLLPKYSIKEIRK